MFKSLSIKAVEATCKAFHDGQKLLEAAFNRTLDQLADNLMRVRAMLTHDG